MSLNKPIPASFYVLFSSFPNDTFVSRKMIGYFSIIQKPKVLRGNIFLDVEIC